MRHANRLQESVFEQTHVETVRLLNKLCSLHSSKYNNFLFFIFDVSASYYLINPIHTIFKEQVTGYLVLDVALRRGICLGEVFCRFPGAVFATARLSATAECCSAFESITAGGGATTARLHAWGYSFN